MSATIDTMTVPAARQLLRDVSNVPSERIVGHAHRGPGVGELRVEDGDAAQHVITAFYAASPANQTCVACGSACAGRNMKPRPVDRVGRAAAAIGRQRGSDVQFSPMVGTYGY